MFTNTLPVGSISGVALIRTPCDGTLFHCMELYSRWFGSPTTGEWKTAGRPGGRPNWKQVCSTWEWMSLKAS